MRSVHSYVDPRNRDGTVIAINDPIRNPAQHATDRNLETSISLLYSQSAKTTEGDGTRSEDGKKSAGASGNAGVIRMSAW